MKVILREDVENLGRIGDMVQVKPGYARNYLIPQGKAGEATVRNIKALEHQKKLVQDRIMKTVKSAEALAQRIESVSVTISQKVGENDRLFGSVTTLHIADALKEEGIEVDKKKILLEEPIKQLGVYSVPIKLHTEVTANLKVWIVEDKE
ncbi:MAG: 50S ribosomal protein L9 [Nitrospirae bacterium CG_4_9_14_3_um_filter_53_35]|nr:MAG: 50S ribosomal protein L9 [Nitrospirae bacterium CG2_30_53_67]PIS36978.1 MAG: 50S ribosomal protein L9 [Nitrospirae bacterium CG08_land_8_20_14_0_20_52_24]PIV83146.1 MAG: 50S ribosomal protein L9 [Nitrospirae bacterium CG17_big_fil_post_rev_8_21_14_2_50_50_9]PIW85755.1 MAG: 50S ribosomal protein L9 [Nitrospirae bacterium CG_4_8_14_3_um_filter_50_41]PIX85776.1 MAG: 50S ribosomal protein L9 [Nitrospirae bacterium CG_4_10_14_3_um_filter_53_41]PJA74491.1 MAG: 50S ribosomal protein L9 [Nitro